MSVSLWNQPQRRARSENRAKPAKITLKSITDRYFGVGCRAPHCFRASSRSIDEYFSGTITTFPPFCLTCRILRSVRLLFHFIPAGKSPSTYCQLGPMTQIPACLTMRQGWSAAKLGMTRKSRRSKLRIGSLAYLWPLAPGVLRGIGGQLRGQVNAPWEILSDFRSTR
jgi:hypothetical protein